VDVTGAPGSAEQSARHRSCISGPRYVGLSDGRSSRLSNRGRDAGRRRDTSVHARPSPCIRSASTTLPQHHCRHARPLLRWPGITLRKRPPGDGPGRTRTCDPLLRRREHLLRATAPCRSSRSASDGSHTAAAFCCGLPLPPRFHVDPPATAIAMSATAPLLLFVQSARGRSARRHARIARGSGRRPGGSTRVRMEPLCASGTAGRDRRPSAAVGSEEPWRLGECGHPTADRDGGSCGAWLTDRRE
jgi:hypothetical protein